MNNFIKYYYNLNDVKIIHQNNRTYLRDNNNTYMILEINNLSRLSDIIELEKYGNRCDPIILNVFGSKYTSINGKNYILIKVYDHKFNMLTELLSNNNYSNFEVKFGNINWLDLWQQKLDYYEYQQQHIKKYDFIAESFNYYLGMGETAISYIRYNYDVSSKVCMVVSHSRINKLDYYNPVNLIFDAKARDVGEYLKYIFIENRYDGFDFKRFFKELNFEREDFILVYARMLYPSFYFDLYDCIINTNVNQKKTSTIISRNHEYENYLKMIYNEINDIIQIPTIDWI